MGMQPWPHIVGYDVSGVVTACGADVTKFRVGDAVFGMMPHDRNGALAEFAALHEDCLAQKPSNLTHVQAASLPLVASTALMAFRKGNLTENKKVLVTGGAGGAGSMAIQVAKRVFKAKTVATTASSKKIERMKALGADEVVDYNREAFERELAEYDFALDCTGESLKCFECVTKGGAVVSIAETPNAEDLSGLEAKGLVVSRMVGFVLNCLSRSVARSARHAQIDYHFCFVYSDGAVLDEVKRLSEEAVITPVIDKVYPFEKADTAMEYLEAGHALGKVVVEIVIQTSS
jgi:NADPH:quinone reductase-like Zn-dependent oxidoreductase